MNPGQLGHNGSEHRPDATSSTASGPLDGCRVLDLTDEHGLLCGQILADLGADVIQVEPPGGSSARRVGPFADGVEDPERSLTWWAYARNKRSLVLDLDTPAGQESLRALARKAHFLIESERPGVMARRGLDAGQLLAANPALIYVSISPFGQDGPRAHEAGGDLIALAAGGPLALGGDDDRPPVRICVPQADAHACADAAVAALIAHHERHRSGRGQHVDISAQQSATLPTQSTILLTACGFGSAQRTAGGVRLGPITSRMVFPARDGHVSITFLFGSTFGPATRRLMNYIHDEGGCDAATRDKDWPRYFEMLMSGEETFAEYERVKRVVADFTASRTKAELWEAARERHLLIAPIATIADVLENPQFRARDYFQAIERPDGKGTARQPGPFAKFSASPIGYRRRAPRIGEHTGEVLAEMKAAPDVPAPAASPIVSVQDTAPLAGVKILDFMWAIAGPAATRMLADFGATVVRIENAAHVDACRTVPPYVKFPPGADDSALFHSLNAGKRMLTLDLARPEAKEVVFDLARWADVVCESFSPKAMRRLGFDYAALRAVKPDVIMLSTCLMGQNGPLADFAGYGNLAAAVTGFYELCGWPDRAPAGPFGAYTDYIAPRYNAAAILAALEHRRRTGEGQHIDLAQAEAALHFLAPALLDYSVNGRVAGRCGNRDVDAAPHGVYPAKGADAWVAVAAYDNAQWRALCGVLGNPDLAADPSLATPAGRRAQAERLDGIVSAWTRERTPREAAGALQQAGVPASAVQDSDAVFHDAQLRHRGHFVQVSHPQGTSWIEGSRLLLSRTPARMDTAAPTLGRDNQYVLAEILGYDEDRITRLIVAGVLE